MVGLFLDFSTAANASMTYCFILILQTFFASSSFIEYSLIMTQIALTTKGQSVRLAASRSFSHENRSLVRLRTANAGITRCLQIAISSSGIVSAIAKVIVPNQILKNFHCQHLLRRGFCPISTYISPASMIR